MAKGSYVNCAIHALGLFCLVMLIQKGEATTFTVGGSKGWCVPSDNSPDFNQWAEKMRFQIGDSLLFVYPTSDSVLRVTQEDYTSCTTTSPLEKYTDGHTEFKFKQSGPHYFISGNKDNCLKNEKLHVVVLADRTNKTTTSPPPSPQPSGAAAGASDHQPAASPSDVSEFTPAPSDEADHPRNGAASFAMTFVGSLGAFVGSSLLLAF